MSSGAMTLRAISSVLVAVRTPSPARGAYAPSTRASGGDSAVRRRSVPPAFHTDSIQSLMTVGSFFAAIRRVYDCTSITSQRAQMARSARQLIAVGHMLGSDLGG